MGRFLECYNIVTFEVFLDRVLNRCVVANKDRSVTTRATVVFFFVDNLSVENGSRGSVSQASVNVISGVYAFRTTYRYAICSGDTSRVACVNYFASNNVCTCSRFAGFNRRFIYSIGSNKGCFSKSGRLIASSDEKCGGVIGNARAGRIICIRSRYVLYGALPGKRVSHFFPVRVNRTQFNSYAVDVRSVAVFKIPARGVESCFARYL